MLLIGSRSAKFHFPFFRKPSDYDFIASEVETRRFLSNFKHTDTSTHPKKIRARIELECPITFEFDLIDYCPSSKAIYQEDMASLYQDPILNTVYHIASPETLFLLKRSHLPFNIHWKKNMTDYLFLKQYVNLDNLSDHWHYIFNMRFEETKERVKYKERNFDVSNSDFFKASEKMVNRLLPHDNIHLATCFFDKPLFMTVKDDLNKAEMNPVKVDALSHNHKIKLIQEEIISLSIERYILPLIKTNQVYNAKEAYASTAAKMVYNYLPMFLRFFAIDNYLEILNLNINYVDKFFKNVKGFNINAGISNS